MREHGRPYTSEEAQALIKACSQGFSGRRNRAHLTLLYRCGLRSAESCAVQLQDLQEEGGRYISIWVRKPKNLMRGAPQRTVGIDKRTDEEIRSWLEVRGTDAGPLFITEPSCREVQTSYLRDIMPRLAKRAGISRRCHPHAFRHTFAKELYEEGVGTVEIQRLLGHSSLQTTSVYLFSIGAHEAVKMSASRVW